MLKIIEREEGTVEVEIDAPQGKILLVRCPEHGAMSIRYTDMAWVCNHQVPPPGIGVDGETVPCGRLFSRLEAQQIIDQCYEEIRQKDQREFREDQQRSTQRLIDRQNGRRAEKKDE